MAVSLIFYKHILLGFRVHFAFGVSETTTKYVDIVRMISSIPSLRERSNEVLWRFECLCEIKHLMR
jgi:hypothetical protein